MQKTLLSILGLILVSCTAPATPASTPTDRILATETLTAVSTVELTVEATETLVPSTPTMDLVHLPTNTPQPAAICPLINDNIRLPLGPAFKDKKAPYHDARRVVLDYLNQGGDPTGAAEKLAEYNIFASILDLTHDGVFEFILPSGYLTVFGCQDGQYVNLLDLPPSKYAQMTAVPLIIEDLNNNGLPEILTGQVEQQILATYQIFEWNGTEFENIAPREFQKETANLYIKNQVIYTRGQSNAEKGALEGNWEIVDVDGNGLNDIIIRAGVYEGAIVSSTLEDSIALEWNGEAYIVAKFLKESTPTPLPTSTPFPFSATCSIKIPELSFQKPEHTNPEKAILDYLNAGGMPEKLDGMTFNVTIKDLNNDTAPEIIAIEYGFPNLMVFTCQNGKYKKAVTLPGDFMISYFNDLTIRDNNKNSFPELFIEAIGCLAERCGGLYVIEWDGDEFIQKIKEYDYSGQIVNYAEMSEPKDAYLKDLDGDGVAEFIWTGELSPDWSGERWEFYPQRLAIHAYKWDGMYYTAQFVEYSAPQFRFQAVQDGDQYSKAGLYEKALEFYQQAETSYELKWWTEDLRDYTIAPYGFGPCADNVSACPQPTQDPNERPILSAYALFKTMVVHFLMNDDINAEAAYQNLLTAHLAETPGYRISEMATIFWNEYHSSQDISKACTQSVAYIKTQSNVLSYLTGGYHVYNDSQGISYESEPSEICPFK